MPAKRVRRLDSVEWRTSNLHDLWSSSEKGESFEFSGSLHSFLQYSLLLREIRQQFNSDDALLHFDANLFFLRGGYFAFAYLNVTSPMALRATIFGGLNHGRHPKNELPVFLRQLRDSVVSSGRSTINMLIIDEVKSGSGMNQILKIVEQSMGMWPGSAKCDVTIHFYAIRPGSSDYMSDDLQNAVRKWLGMHNTNGGRLFIEIKHFAGPLLSYDDDILCGVRKLSKGADLNEAYELVKLSGGKVTLHCDCTGSPVFQADIGTNCLVEFLASCAVKWTSDAQSALTIALARDIETQGCSICRDLYLSSTAA